MATHFFVSLRHLFMKNNSVAFSHISRHNVSLVPCVSYATHRKGVSGRRKGNQIQQQPFDSAEDIEDYEDSHDLLSKIIEQADVEDASTGEKSHREELVKYIIRRKYFRPPQETNMMTWSAKEQLRYLSAEHGDEWTPERLSESFPISVQGVHRLLKSRFVPRMPKDIAKHDRHVAQRWTALLSGKSGADVKDKKLLMLRNASAGTLSSVANEMQLSVKNSSSDDEQASVGKKFVSLLPNKKINKRRTFLRLLDKEQGPIMSNCLDKHHNMK